MEDSPVLSVNSCVLQAGVSLLLRQYELEGYTTVLLLAPAAVLPAV